MAFPAFDAPGLHGRPNGATSKGGSRVSQFFEPCEGAAWPNSSGTGDARTVTFNGNTDGYVKIAIKNGDLVRGFTH
jgi:hypothetical protein